MKNKTIFGVTQGAPIYTEHLIAANVPSLVLRGQGLGGLEEIGRTGVGDSSNERS